MSQPWDVVAAALGSSLLTSAGTFGLVRWQAALQSRAASRDRLREACVRLASHGQSLALRARILRQTAVSRSGIGEGLDVALHYRKPLDLMELSDWLAADLHPMIEAQSVIEITADADIIRVASDLMVAAASVLGTATSFARMDGTTPKGGRDAARRFLSTLRPLYDDPKTEAAIVDAVRELGRQLRLFTRLTRDRLGVNDPDAVIRAFPGLFVDAADGSVPPPADSPFGETSGVERETSGSGSFEGRVR